MRTVEINELSQAELLSNFESRVLTVAPLLKGLPFDSEELHWKDLERLIARLALHPKGANLVDAFLYGSSGQAQDGVDVIANDKYRKLDYVFQCKHVRTIKRGELQAWIKDFLKGKFSNTVTSYYLCLATDVNDTHLIHEWGVCQTLLQDKGIRPILWARSQIEDMLRDIPELVTQLFGHAAMERFCTTKIPIASNKPCQSYRTQYCDFYGRSMTLENESVRCSMFMPGDGHMDISAALSFARNDLRGVTLTIPGRTLFKWLRWRAYAKPNKARPYALNPIESQQPDQFFFQSPSAGIMLTKKEVEQLDWIFQQAWPITLEALSKQESYWKTLRFRKIENRSEPIYALVEIHRFFWQSIQKFAEVHDTDNGSSSWHIFD